MSEALDSTEVRARTLRWVERFVIGLNLCPFARGPIDAGLVHIAVSDTSEPEELLAVLDIELDRLLAHEPRELETSLLVHPRCLLEFEHFNAFMDSVDVLLEARELVGEIQVVGFHPDYRFADAPTDDPANYSNRSPHPMLHLLRERSVERAVERHPDIEGVVERNLETLRSLDQATLERQRRADP